MKSAFTCLFLEFLNILPYRISEKSEVLHQLQQDFQETNQQISSLKSKVDELKSTIAEKEMQLQNMRDNLTQMHTLYEEKVTKQKQLDLESDKLKSLENELQDALKDNETKLKVNFLINCVNSTVIGHFRQSWKSPTSCTNLRKKKKN